MSAGIGRTTAVDEIDSYRDNYWCTEPPVPQAIPLGDEDPQNANKARPVAVPDFLKAGQAVGDRGHDLGACEITDRLVDTGEQRGDPMRRGGRLLDRLTKLVEIPAPEAPH